MCFFSLKAKEEEDLETGGFAAASEHSTAKSAKDAHYKKVQTEGRGTPMLKLHTMREELSQFPSLKDTPNAFYKCALL